MVRSGGSLHPDGESAVLRQRERGPTNYRAGFGPVRAEVCADTTIGELMDLRDMLAALRAGWWLAVMGLVLGGVAALAVSLLMTPLYTASTQLFVSSTDSSSTSAAVQGSQFSQDRVATYAEMITSEELANRVVDQFALTLSSDQVRSEIAVEVVPRTLLLNVSVSDASPQQAQQIAAGIGTQFPRLVSELETSATGTAPVRVTVLDQPEVPQTASSPNTVLNVLLGSLFGLLLGVGAAIARARLDRSIRKPEEAAEVAGAPVIGVVLRHHGLETRHVVDRSRMSRMAEDYRHLRANLQFLDVDRPPKVIMVSSALPTEGKTTVVVNLALALADAGRKVTVVEGDLRKPKVSRYLGMVGGVGLTNVLAGTADLEEVTQFYGSGVAVVPAGPIPPNPGELLASSSMSDLLDKLRASNDYVLVDSPPLLPVADATGLAVLVDGVLLSVRYGTTRKDQLEQAATTLDRVGARTLGIILNIVPPKAQVASAFGYGYGYEADQPHG
jgi:capsular exopolysaccharide synthesis family protein